MPNNATPTAARPGPFTPPRFDPASAPGILAYIEQTEHPRLADLRPRLGLSPYGQNHLITTGLIKPEHLGGRGNPYAITRDEARKMLLAALLAVAAGVALSIMLRGLVEAGVTGKVAAEVLRATVPT